VVTAIPEHLVRRRLLTTTLLFALAAGSAWAGAGDGRAASAPHSWADAAIRTVTSHGLMGGNAAKFRPSAVLTSGALARLVAGLAGRPVADVADPTVPVTMAQLDARLVRALGLGRTAIAFTRTARTAGLKPPVRFGTEVAARLLALRIDHPAADDGLELRPGDPATRAEAAYSAARILGLSGAEVPAVEQAEAAFTLPALGSWQRRVLATAVHFIGYPYVWGGTSESRQTLFGVTSRGGFDCSGFVWRVFKLQAYPGARSLAGVFRGRGAADMAGEVPRALRIHYASLEPADVLFFAAHGAKSRYSEVNHTAVYLGNGWLIQSSGQGVALAPVAGWYRQRFAWGRRPLAEAGLGE
jgi:cell wall-associated NlpC family hydrolase